MGCLPLPILFLLGCGIGYLAAGQDGALWGAGAGLVAGLALVLVFVRLLKGRQR
jgi:hypothetical protein